MTAVLLALCSAALFGAMTVLVPPALRTGVSGEAAALLTVLPALTITAVVALIAAEPSLQGTGPFLLAGVLGPGCSQLLFMLGVREAGASRTSVTLGTAPLFSVAIALVVLGEPVVAGVLAGALLVVAGGVLLITERDRPSHFRRIGIAFAFGSAIVFAVRDNLVRWLSDDTPVEPALAATAALTAGAATILASVVLGRRTVSARRLPAFVPAGVCFGLSYVCLFEAYYRGRVTVVSPLVATESLWGVALSAIFLRRHELVGPRLAVGAAFVVAGGVLIGAFR